MKDKIYTTVELNLDNVTLSLSVRENLKKEEGNCKNFGCVKIHDGSLDSKEVFWDGIPFFIDCCFGGKKKKFKKECKKDLDKANYNWKEVYRTVKKLLKRAEKLNLITVENESI